MKVRIFNSGRTCLGQTSPSKRDITLPAGRQSLLKIYNIEKYYRLLSMFRVLIRVSAKLKAS